MDGHTFHIVDAQAGNSRKPLHRRQAEVAEVLVINGIELQIVDQISEIRHFHYDDAVGLESLLQCGKELSRLRHVRKYVVRVNDVGAPASTGEAFGEIAVEKFNEGRDASLPLRNCRDVGRRLDTEHGNAAIAIELQQIAIVAGNLDHEVMPGKSPCCDSRFHQLSCVTEHFLRKRRGVDVVRKQHLRWDRLADLRERACGTKIKYQRIALFRLRQPLGGQQRVGQRQELKSRIWWRSPRPQPRHTGC